MKAVIAFLLALAMMPAALAQTPSPGRQLFLFIYRPGPAWVAGQPMARQNLREHAAYHARLVREGRSVAGGGFAGMDGGMAIVRAADRADAEAMLAADPAITNGVFAADIRHWQPRFDSGEPLADRPR